MHENRKTIGLALSGASTRSIFYIGFFEVLQEQNFKVDYIAATSSAAIPAAAYACGTLEKLKTQALNLNKEFLLSILEKNGSGRGIYRLERVRLALENFTDGLKFEEVRPLMGFVTTDINSGEEVVLSIGDIAKAACATCALPIMFEPAKWGNRSLVDGGLISVVPGEAVKRAGIDKVIGIHLRTTAYVFGRWELWLKKVFDAASEFFSFNSAGRLFSRLLKKFSRNEYLEYLVSAENLNDRDYSPGMFAVLGKAMDISITAQMKDHPKTSNYGCDMMIIPDIPKIPIIKRLLYMHFTDFSNAKQLYELGRKTALDYLPQMCKLAALETGSQIAFAEPALHNA